MIVTNRIKCKKCGDIITSYNVHDFKFCKCGAVAVDGGHEYLKRCGELGDWEDLSICPHYDWEDAMYEIQSSWNEEELKERGVTLKDIQKVIRELERYMHSYHMIKEKECVN